MVEEAKGKSQYYDFIRNFKSMPISNMKVSSTFENELKKELKKMLILTDIKSLPFREHM